MLKAGSDNTQNEYAISNISMTCEGGLRTKGEVKVHTTEHPLVSIITVVFNGANFLEHTIQSVLKQTYAPIEYIIIDGGSTDKTLDIIKQYENNIDFWKSEPDQGIADAFNKGLANAQGEIIGIINADDWYEPAAVTHVIEAFQRTQAGVVFGDMQCWKNHTRDYLFNANQSMLKWEMSINHPATFIKRSIYHQYGNYNITYRLAMDYELLLRFQQKGVPFVHVKEVLANLRWDGASDRRFIEGFREVKRAKDTYYGKKIFHYVYFLKQIISTVLPRFLNKVGLSFLVKFYRRNLSPVRKERI